MTVKELVHVLQDYALDEEKANMQVTISSSDIEDAHKEDGIWIVDATSESGYESQGFENVVELRLKNIDV